MESDPLLTYLDSRSNETAMSCGTLLITSTLSRQDFITKHMSQSRKLQNLTNLSIRTASHVDNEYQSK